MFARAGAGREAERKRAAIEQVSFFLQSVHTVRALLTLIVYIVRYVTFPLPCMMMSRTSPRSLSVVVYVCMCA